MATHISTKGTSGTENESEENMVTTETHQIAPYHSSELLYIQISGRKGSFVSPQPIEARTRELL